MGEQDRADGRPSNKAEVRDISDVVWGAIGPRTRFEGSEQNLCSVMDAIEESEMKALIAKGNKDGFTLLMRAAANDRPEAVAVLPSKGADICARDQRGNTALMYACMRGNLSVVKVLLRAGANAGAENLYGHCVLLTAWNCGHWDVVKCLLGHGDGINVSLGTHLTGCMLLWNAILDNRADQIITLLRAGTDSMVKDTHGFTVFDLVKDNEKCNHWLPHVQWWHNQLTLGKLDKASQMSDDVCALYCPLSSVLMTDAVIAADGVTYQRSALKKWTEQCYHLRSAPTYSSPEKGGMLASSILMPNREVCRRVTEYVKNKVQQAKAARARARA